MSDSISATYVNATTFTATVDADGKKDLTGQCAIGTRIRADCGTDGYKYGVVSAVSYSDPTTTIVITGDSLTATLTAFWHGNDSPDSIANHEHKGPADGGAIPHIYSGTTPPTPGVYPPGSIYIKYSV